MSEEKVKLSVLLSEPILTANWHQKLAKGLTHTLSNLQCDIICSVLVLDLHQTVCVLVCNQPYSTDDK